ncbi:helix-turn-helix domain-containing protein [Pedobacter sp. HMF7647]|uniref:Helix-turn-helix domain-containing protein n=1 Tax=Hufsiella arboris TaxID=2695275 RepID=A0A7K1YA93_9SPHI|nr:helix-turn-helix transcriptional regulator [Hufsiella arboris]MXV51507.1 helix-turn-helix domain-containing protein [Hufsiella arboris]
MKKDKQKYKGFTSITEAHRLLGLPAPRHPLITLMNAEQTVAVSDELAGKHVLHFYKISYQPPMSPKLRYGQQYYDFDEGGLLFAAPGQVIGEDNRDEPPPRICSEQTLIIHPDFLLGYPLAKKIKQYHFFSYAVNEALHLSEGEKETILSIFSMIEAELNSRIDDLSQDVIISQLELLLNFSQRFYKRQFITRKVVNNDLLAKLEDLVDTYFNSDASLRNGLPTVHYFSDQLNISPSYLSDMLRSLIGQNAQQYLHEKLINKAKEKLSTTSLSVSEIAFELGFEHSQSFSKLFKSKTSQSPIEFRAAFN